MSGLSVVVGAQWGDEGKGKIVDMLAETRDVVVRYQGGNNAGHTLVIGDETYKLRLIPCGILYPGTICVLGQGCVIDPEILIEELDGLEERGIDTSGLRISGNAHLIMPWHKIIDADSELALGRLAIGTTRPRHRPGLRRQGVSRRHPGAGPAGREDPAAEDPDRALESRTSCSRRCTTTGRWTKTS